MSEIPDFNGAFDKVLGTIEDYSTR